MFTSNSKSRSSVRLRSAIILFLIISMLLIQNTVLFLPSSSNDQRITGYTDDLVWREELFSSNDIDINVVTPDNSTYTDPMSGYHPATHGFENEVHGTTGTDMDFLDEYYGHALSSYTDIRALDGPGDGHRKYMEMRDSQGGTNTWGVHYFENSHSSGTIEFYLWANNPTTVGSATKRMYIYFRRADDIIAFRMMVELHNERTQYYDGSSWQDLAYHTPNVWYHHSISFDCNAGTNGQFTWIVSDSTGNEIGRAQDIEFENNVASIDELYFGTHVSDYRGTTRWDAFGYSWDPDYSIGDNFNEGLLLGYNSNTTLDWCGYSLDGQPTKTILGNTTLTMPSNGLHTIQVFGNDTLSNQGQSDVRYFTVSTSSPVEDIYTLPGSIYVYQWSPDGSKVAYIKCPPGQYWNCELWVADKSPFTSQLINHQLIYTGAAYSSLFDWKDEWILFSIRFEDGSASSYYGRRELWKIRADGTGLTQVTFTHTNGIRTTSSNPTWINEGTVSWARFIPETNLVYFSAHNGDGWYKSYVCNDDGTDNWQHRSDPDYSFTIAMSPTGNKLLWGHATYWNDPTTLRACNVDGSGRTTIRSFTERTGALVLSDGNTVIWHFNDNIYAINMDGTNERTVIADTNENRWWNYNPLDGNELIMGSDREDGNMHLFNINVNGTEIVQLTDGPYLDEYPFYSPDGEYLMYRRLPFDYHQDTNPQPWPYEMVIKKLTTSTNINQPVLSNGSASPLIGDQNTEFSFQVEYTDLDDDPPSYINVVINGSAYPMQKVDSNDNNFTDGCVYQATVYLQPSLNNYSYYFECNDSMYYNATAIFNNIKVNKVNNFEPFLVSPLLSPEIGNYDTIFNFTVWYYDGDNNYPTNVNITINDTTYLMSSVDPFDTNSTDGLEFYFNTSLPFGYYQFQINCSDGEFTNVTSWIIGPEVNPFFNVPEIILLTPPDDGILFNGWYNFTWENLNLPFGSVNYTFQISNSTDFSYLFEDIKDITEEPLSSKVYVNLDYQNNIYYWRVCPTYDYFVGDWSNISNFELNVNDYSPTLIYASINQTIGDEYTIFNFSVSYFDQDNNTPAIIDVLINSIPYGMTKVNPSDNNYVDGCTFQYLTSLPVSPVNYTYSFNCSDGLYSNSTTIFSNLKVNKANYYAPYLLFPQVSPVIGGYDTIFNFTVWYFDSDNNYPTIVNITINETLYLMSPADLSDNDATDGILYFMNTTLAFGNYQFQINCFDGKFENSTSWVNGPEVDPFYYISDVELLTPLNLSYIFTDWINFEWQSIEASFGTVNFTLQISNVSNFSEIIFEKVDILEQPFTTNLTIFLNFPSGIYYWRVCPTYESFTGDWSEYFIFNLTADYFAPSLNFGSVSPKIGDQYTIFNFTVTYFDQDDNPPNFLNVIINGSVYAMEQVNPLDINYVDGCLFQYLTALAFSSQNYTYSFDTSDGKYNESTLIFGNLEVNPANNFAPLLQDPQFTPGTGGTSTIFEFTVWYFDNDNNLPTTVNITIDSIEYQMSQFNLSDDNALDGILFYYSTVLDIGVHSFNIACSDGIFTNSTGFLIGPEVNPFYNTVPITLLEPIYNAELPAGLINFSWQSLDALFGTVNYTIQISNSTNYASILYEITDIPETSLTTDIQIDINLPTGIYYWRVKPTFGIFSGNWSNNFKINIVRNTNAPILSSISILPSTGNQDTIFKFIVIYQDLDNNAPVFVRIIINGKIFSMQKQNPNDYDYIDGCVYQYLTLLHPSKDTYTYSFECYDGIFYESSPIYEGLLVSDEDPVYDRNKGLSNRDA
ncbi:MAG: hypothetical protein ACFFE4_06625, partial [Candidatus Thorarchaeota archaeon]